MDPPGGGLGFTASPAKPGHSLSHRNPVARFYETWWVSPQGEVHEAVDEGSPGHCAWLEQNFGICSRADARKLGWVRVGWNLTRFYIDGRPERIEASRPAIEGLLGRHPMVREVLLEHGSDLSSILTPEEFLTRGA